MDGNFPITPFRYFFFEFVLLFSCYYVCYLLSLFCLFNFPCEGGGCFCVSCFGVCFLCVLCSFCWEEDFSIYYNGNLHSSGEPFHISSFSFFMCSWTVYQWVELLRSVPCLPVDSDSFVCFYALDFYFPKWVSIPHSISFVNLAPESPDPFIFMKQSLLSLMRQ